MKVTSAHEVLLSLPASESALVFGGMPFPLNAQLILFFDPFSSSARASSIGPQSAVVPNVIIADERHGNCLALQPQYLPLLLHSGDVVLK